MLVNAKCFLKVVQQVKRPSKFLEQEIFLHSGGNRFTNNTPQCAIPQMQADCLIRQPNKHSNQFVHWSIFHIIVQAYLLTIHFIILHIVVSCYFQSLGFIVKCRSTAQMHFVFRVKSYTVVKLRNFRIQIIYQRRCQFSLCCRLIS